MGIRFSQSDNVRDHVLPLAMASRAPGGHRLTRLLGTGFLIGSHGHGLTAGHVLAAGAATAGEEEYPVALLVGLDGDAETWLALELETVSHHPSEDLILFTVRWPATSGAISPILRLRPSREYGGFQYFLWGYPDDTYYELGEGAQRPDLIYSEGHIRRRLTGVQVPAIRGSFFLELSTVAGGGCSGAPVVARASIGAPQWDVVGVYLGERVNDRATSVAYALPLDRVASWLALQGLESEHVRAL